MNRKHISIFIHLSIIIVICFWIMFLINVYNKHNKPSKGAIDNWAICNTSISLYEPINATNMHVIGKYKGQFVRTSKIVNINFASSLVETENSVYTLGNQSEDYRLYLLSLDK